jgi:Sas10/Utp3/C1D family
MKSRMIEVFRGGPPWGWAPCGLAWPRLKLVEATKKTAMAAYISGLLPGRQLKGGQIATAEGLSYLEAKNHLLLHYIATLAFLVLLRAEGRPFQVRCLVQLYFSPFFCGRSFFFWYASFLGWRVNVSLPWLAYPCS